LFFFKQKTAYEI